MHAVFDSKTLRAQAAMATYESKQQEQRDWFLQKMETRRYAEINDYGNIERQQGRRLTAPSLESKIKKLVPQAVFITRPLSDSNALFCGLAPGSSLKSLDIKKPDNTQYPLIGYQNHPIVPEYSIILHRKVKIQNPLVKEADSSQFPKSEKVKQADGTYKWVFDGPTPFEIETYEECGTIVGWRSILARLVRERLTTPEACDREFGTSDRLSWAVRSGRRDEALHIY